MNLDVTQVKGDVLLVSAFTVYADARKGRRPSFDACARGEVAEPLVSALARALRGFGLTVGETPIAYHFTFHTDGHVYFDSAPEAARPAPIIPTPELLHGGIAPTATPAATPPDDSQRGGNDEAAEHPPAVESETVSGTGQRWRLVLFIGLGLTVGSGLHLWSRRKERRRNRTAPRDKVAPAVEEDSDA